MVASVNFRFSTLSNSDNSSSVTQTQSKSPQRPVHEIPLYSRRDAALSVAPTDSAHPQRVAIAEVLYKNRRPVPNEGMGIVSPENYQQGILSKIDAFISNNKPIHLVIPAFPFKSESPIKTLGKCEEKQPDMAEQLSLRHLNEICLKIKSSYPPGAKITIYSDGGVFADTLLPEYTDKSRINYLDKLKKMISSMGASDVIDVNDTEGKVSDEIWKNHSESLESIRSKIKEDENFRLLYCGQKKFWTEEAKALNPELSRFAVEKQGGKRAYGITQGSAALSKYLDLKEPHAIRISCHPKTLDSEKIGLWMDEGKSTVTPWHGAAALTNRPDSYSVMHVKDAQRLGLEQVNDTEGKPSHFEIPEKLNRAVLLIQNRLREKRAGRRADAAARRFNAENVTPDIEVRK